MWSENHDRKKGAYCELIKKAGAIISPERRGKKKRNMKPNIGDPNATLRFVTKNPKVLCLAMRYESDILNGCLPGEIVDRLDHCVKTGILTPMVARDTWRCHSLSKKFNTDVLSLSRNGETTQNHLWTEFSNRKLIQRVQEFLAKRETRIPFVRIILDYFWIPEGYAKDTYGRTIFFLPLILC